MQGNKRFSALITVVVCAACVSHFLLPVAHAQTNNCAGATPIGEGTYFGTTVGATNDGNAYCGESYTAPDVWYRYTAPRTGRLNVETCGSSFNTVLSLHPSCPGLDANQIVCSDNSCGLQSSLETVVSAGAVLYIRISGFQGASGAYQLTLTLSDLPPRVPGANLVAGNLGVMQQAGRVGSIIGVGVSSTLCNNGSDPVDWQPNPDSHHPFITNNLYRLKGDRFEQVGQAWIKHAFAAAQIDECSFGCIPTASGDLGSGCSDTYSAGLNATQSTLSPRSEINPWTGAFTYAGSYIDTHPGQSYNPIQHRMQVRDADLDPAANAGARYFVELYAVANDDVNHLDSIGWKEIGVSGSVGGTWSFDLSIQPTIVGPALDAWNGAVKTTIPAAPSIDGRCILSAKVTDNGNGTWHYEYALFNLDMDRGVGSLRVPVPNSVTVTNIGFSAVRSHEESYSNNAWTSTRDASGLTWAAEPYSANPFANVLRWGTLYNFRFDANAPPQNVNATLGLFKPGTPTTLAGATRGPAALRLLGDMNCDGLMNNFDIDPFVEAIISPAAYAAHFPGCDIMNGDANNDGAFNNFDIDPFVGMLVGR